jgi:hypothetical protein
MLEIPESYNLAKQLNNTIVGKTRGERHREGSVRKPGWI